MQRRTQSYSHIPQMGDTRATNSLSKSHAEYLFTQLHQLPNRRKR